MSTNQTSVSEMFGNGISKNQTPGNQTSLNEILENQTLRSQISGNQTQNATSLHQIFGNQVSGNQVSMNHTSVNQNLGNLTSLNPIELPNNCSRTLIDSAVDVLPGDIDLTTFLLSPQMQMAWYTQLTMTASEKEATLFKKVMISSHLCNNVS